MNGLILHAGAASASLAEVAAVATPEAQGEWHPIPHALLLNTVVEELTSTGMQVAASEYGLWQDGNRFFGTLALTNKDHAHDDYQLVVGVRNSHDKAFAAGLVMGSRVFVCDNLAFSGEVKFSRKHTTNILRDLPGLANRAVTRLNDLRGFQDTRIETYKTWLVTDEMAHDFVIRTVDMGILPPTNIKKLLDEWRNPKHEEFQPRTAWSLFNAYTEVWKGAPTAIVNRALTLHGMVDQMTGVTVPKAVEEIDEADYEIVEAA
ncbi:MAG: DUF932 domain-containing protein [Gemmatimonadaceae bacterium]